MTLTARNTPAWGPAAMTERRWQARVVALLEATGWMVYHTYDSRRSAPGFPDLIAVREGRMLAIECKTLKGRATPEQLAWIAALDGVKVVDAFVSRPSDDLSALEELLA